MENQSQSVLLSDYMDTAEGKLALDSACRKLLANRMILAWIMKCTIREYRDYDPGYPLVKRGIYYGSRLISAQYGTEFINSHYEKIKKVYSIWVCIHAPRHLCGSMRKYSIMESGLIGSYKEPPEHYDLMTVVMLCLGKSSGQEQSDLESQVIELLTVLFSEELDTDTKKMYLENKYHIPMTAETETEADNMCSYSDYIEQRGIEKGIETLLGTCRKLHISRELVFEQLISSYAMTPENAEAYMVKYWG